MKKDKTRAGQTVPLDSLVGSERRRLKQMETNTHWLINQIDAIHFALCPDQNGTWQQRAEQSVKAARAIASNAEISGEKGAE